MDNGIVFYDGICALCHQSVKIIIYLDKKRKLRYAPLQGEAFKKIIEQPQIPETIVFYNNKQLYYKSNAILQILRYLGWPYKVFFYLKVIPLRFRDLIYDFIAKNRYSWFGKYDSCRLPQENEKDLFID